MGLVLGNMLDWILRLVPVFIVALLLIRQALLQVRQALAAPQAGISDASLAELVAKQVRTTMLELVWEGASASCFLWFRSFHST